MSDYIKREDAKKTACELCELYGICGDGCKDHPIDAIPAADVVEVVRCENCKYAKRNDKHPDKPLICYLTRRVGEVKDGWFCADGERGSEWTTIPMGTGSAVTEKTSHAVSAGRRK